MTDCNPVLTPMEVGQSLSSAGCPDVIDKVNIKEYQQLVGSLNYLVAWSKADLAFPVSQCSRFMGTADVGITYTANSAGPNQLYAFVDADHAGDSEGRRSVTGYVVMMNGGATGSVLWESKRQKVTALSSAESKFYTAPAVGCKIMYLCSVLSTMGFDQDGPTPVAEDNVHASSRPSHQCCSTKESTSTLGSISYAADCLTKSLPSEALNRHRIVIAGRDDQAKKLPGSQVNATFQAVNIKTPGILLSGVLDAARMPGRKGSKHEASYMGGPADEHYGAAAEAKLARWETEDVRIDSIVKSKVRFVASGATYYDYDDRASADSGSQD
eukprot:3789853-Rhodomonas_salina.1